MIVGSVSSEVYRRIEEHVRKGAGAPDPSQPEIAPRRRRNPRQNKTRTCAQSRLPSATADPTSPSRATIPGRPCGSAARVLAAYWNEKREFEGFWLATVKRIEHGEFTLEWFEAPEYPAFKSRPKNIAIPHPGVPRLGQVARRMRSPQRSSFSSHGAAFGSPLFVPRLPMNQARAIPPQHQETKP